MLRLLTRWPPAVYVLVSLGSIFASLGMQRHWLLPLGVALQALALIIALALALERRTNRPRPTWLLLVIAGVAAFYLFNAAG